MKKSSYPILFLFIGFLHLQGCNEVPKGDPIVIGGIFNTSGEFSENDIPALQGAILAVDDINKSGGVLGRELVMVKRDGASSELILEHKVEKLIERYPQTCAFVGLTATESLLSPAQKAAQLQRPFVSVGVTSRALLEEVPEYLFMNTFSNEAQVRSAVDFALEDLKSTKAVLFYNHEDPYSTNLRDLFSDEFTAMGGDIIQVCSYDPTSVRLNDQMLDEADLVFLAATNPQVAVRLIRMIRARGFDIPIVGGDAMEDRYMWNKQRSIKDVYYVEHMYFNEDSTGVQGQFEDSFDRMYMMIKPEGFHALGYDAVLLIARAIERAGTDEPKAVKKALSESTNFIGVTGRYDFSQNKRAPDKDVYIIKWKDGKAHLAYKGRNN